MKRLITGATALVVAAGLAAVGSVESATAAPGAGNSGERAANHAHDRPGPLAAKQRELLAKARELQAAGKIPPGAKKARIGKGPKGQYVELAREGEDSIWTLLVEYGDQEATHDHGSFGTVHHGGAKGPVHNEIPEPDRAEDNSTIWAPDFSRDYFLDLLFSEEPGANSMRNYYIEQSGNRYTVNGDVTEWTQVPYNAAAYGSNYCGDIVCSRDVQRLLEDGLSAWYQKQLQAGKTAAQVDEYLSRFDQWDRYDHNSNGVFTEPDGYIDHFQTVHAGEGEETGGGVLGEDAIWSHRSYTNIGGLGETGPDSNRLGGVRVGESSYWVGDYTVEPENGGVGVFAHEFAHDLALPDLYDTSGNTGGAENSTAFWTLMSSGSYGNTGRPEDGIGDHPTHMGAWDKLMLGWLDYELVRPGDGTRAVRLGPAEQTTKASEAAIVALPQKTVTAELGEPFSGEKFYYGGTGDESDIFMTREVTLPEEAAGLTALARYNIETGWDHAYLVVSTDGGETWNRVETNLSTDDDPHDQNFGNGITGVSNDWTPLTADLGDFAGQTVTLGFEYWTDAAAQGNPGESELPPGIQLDDIQVPGQPLDGAESDAGWAFTPAGGFRVTTGTESEQVNHYYLAENRQYLGYDKGLRDGPYNFTNAAGRPNEVQHFPYQDGLLVWYWDTSMADNNVGDHPGEGLVLPVDANPGIMRWAGVPTAGSVARMRIQSYDSTFGLERTDPFTLKQEMGGATATLEAPARAAVPVFDDSRSYWTSGDDGDAPGGGRYQAEWSSVKVPMTGTRIEVAGQSAGGFLQIRVRAPR